MYIYFLRVKYSIKNYKYIAYQKTDHSILNAPSANSTLRFFKKNLWNQYMENTIEINKIDIIKLK